MITWRSSLLAALFARVFTLLVLVIVAVGALAFVSANQQISDSYDATLITGANLLYALMGEELQTRSAAKGEPLEVDDAALLSREDRSAFNAYARDRMFRIWRKGTLLLGSDTGPQLDSPGVAANGFMNVTQADVTWRIYRLAAPGSDVAIDVGERVATRSVLVRRIALGLAFPLTLLIPAAVALIWFSLAGGLRALRSFASELRRRSLSDLSEIDAARWPRDLIPLIRTTNHLFERLAHALQQERRFIAHAAHELRTPLSTIKLQTQLIAREQEEKPRRELVAQLETSVNRAADLTDRLLTLARLEAETSTTGRTDLAAETAAVLADLAPIAASRQITLVYQGAPACVSGEATLVRLIAVNLIENAIRHTPAGGEVEVSIEVADPVCRLVVTDTGQGIAPAERERVFERFYRGMHAIGGGAGLGLSIVAEAVRVLGGRAELTDRPDGASGLRACVTIPPATLLAP